MSLFQMAGNWLITLSLTGIKTPTCSCIKEVNREPNLVNNQKIFKVHVALVMTF